MLLDRGFPSGAYYLSGYAVECALKACIAKQTRRYDFPRDRKAVEQSYTHDFDTLLGPADLRVALRDELARDPRFVVYWATAKEWSEAARYTTHEDHAARAMIEAVSDSRHGVLRWIRRYW